LLCSIERDAQLLANRIALLKQEEMKTWKKIDDTKKRTGEILTLKKRNEDKIQKVSRPSQTKAILMLTLLIEFLESVRVPSAGRQPETAVLKQLHVE